MPSTAVCRNRNSRLGWEKYPKLQWLFHSSIKNIKIRTYRSYNADQFPCENSSHTLLFMAYSKGPTLLLSSLGPERDPPVREAYVQVWFCVYLNIDLGAAYRPACRATEKAPRPHLSQKLGQNLPVPHLLWQNVYADFSISQEYLHLSSLT